MTTCVEYSVITKPTHCKQWTNKFVQLCTKSFIKSYLWKNLKKYISYECQGQCPLSQYLDIGIYNHNYLF